MILPDFVFILDVPVNVALKRLAEKGVVADGFERKDFLEGVRKRFKVFVRRSRELNWSDQTCNSFVIDARGDFQSIITKILSILERKTDIEFKKV